MVTLEGKRRFVLLGRTANKPPAFQAKGAGPVGPSQESDTRETGAFLSLTPTDGADKEDDIVVERRNSKAIGGIILALGK